MARLGKCHLCGKYSKLSYEHVPPSAAYNDMRILELDTIKIIKSKRSLAEIEACSGKINQRGSGAYTLCQQCNSQTGSWYGQEYVKVAKHFMPIVIQSSFFDEAYTTLQMHPLRFLKQIFVMFCSVNPPEFSASRTYLIRYLLNKQSQAIPDELDVWMGIFDIEASRACRSTALTQAVHVSGHSQRFSEITHPPFVFVMTDAATAPPDKRLFNLRFMNEFEYFQAGAVPFRLAKLAIVSVYPGHYPAADDIKMSHV